MADTSNLSNYLKDIANAIRTKKETSEEIPASEFDDEILSIETGIDTSDADATTNDIIGDKTAYVNGEKITGAIIPTYNSSLPEEIDRAIYYSTIDDINLDYNIAICASSTSSIKVYRVNESDISSSYTSVSTSDFNSTEVTSFFTNTAKLAQKKYTDENGVDYLRAYVGAKGDTKAYIISFLININTLEISDHMFANTNHPRGYTPSLAVIPNTNSNCMIISHQIGSDTSYSFWQVYQFTKTEVLSLSNGNVGVSDSNTATGLAGVTVQFSDDGTLFVFCACHKRYDGNLTGGYVVTSPDGFKTCTVLASGSGNRGSTAYLYKLIDNNKVSIQNNIYDINNLASPIGTLPYAVTYQTQGIQIGKYLYYLETASSMSLKVYEIGDTALSLVNTITITANKWFFHYAKEVLYTNNDNNIVGYKIGELGSLIAMRRLGTNFYNLYEASNTTSDDVLQSKVVYLNNGKTIGTMKNNAGIIITPLEAKITIPEGYHDGTGYVEPVEITSLTDYNNCLYISEEILEGVITNYVSLPYLVWDNTGAAPASFDTGIYLFQASKSWKLSFDLTLNSIFNYQHLFYFYDISGSAKIKYNECWVYSTGQFAVRLNNTKYTFNTLLEANVRYKIDIEYSITDKLLTITVNDGVQTYSGVSLSQTDYTLKIGSIKNDDGTANREDINVYNIQMYMDDELQMNLIPVRTLDDFGIYLYDTVSENYYRPSTKDFSY